MQTTTKIILAVCCIGAVAVETLTPVYAHARCRPGWTVQGGRCQPYRYSDPRGYWQGGWNNNWGGGWGPGWRGGWGGGWGPGWGGGGPGGCPPGWTRQGGRCAPYRYGR
jgi:hypothetical protein